MWKFYSDSCAIIWLRENRVPIKNDGKNSEMWNNFEGLEHLYWQGWHGQGKVREIPVLIRVREKSGNSFASHGFFLPSLWQPWLTYPWQFVVEISPDDIMKWKLFLHYCPFVMGIYMSSVDSTYKGPVMQSFGICFVVSLSKHLTNNWVAGELRHHAFQWFSLRLE